MPPTPRRPTCHLCGRRITPRRLWWHLTGCRIACSRCLDGGDRYDEITDYDGCDVQIGPAAGAS